MVWHGMAWTIFVEPYLLLHAMKLAFSVGIKEPNLADFAHLKNDILSIFVCAIINHRIP